MESFSIKQWSEEDRPREKLASQGRQNLTDAELIAILIGSGSRELSAVDLAKRILANCNNDLNQLAKLSLKDLTKFKGIGEAKAISIAAALELARRRKPESFDIKKSITSSADAFEIMKGHFLDLPHEEFRVLMLNQANKTIKQELIGRGGITGTVADSRLIFRTALENRAVALILFHNHPSGRLVPSEADKQLTKKLLKAGKTLDIKVLDHLIVSDAGYFSFADEGILE